MVLYARDVMKKYTKTFDKEVSALDGAEVMAQDHVGFLIVRGDDGKPVGIVTEWDYISKVVVTRKDPASVKLKEIMREGIISVEGKVPTDEVTEIMGENSIRRLPVLENGELIGVITSRDIIRIFRDYMDNLSRMISRFSTT